MTRNRMVGRRVVLGLLALILIGGPSPAEGNQLQPTEKKNEAAGSIGIWLGSTIVTRGVMLSDPQLGPVGFNVTLDEGNSAYFGLRYRRLISRLFSAEATFGFTQNDWTLRSSSPGNGVVTSPPNQSLSAATTALSGNAVLTLPVSPQSVVPFVSAGAGAVHYEGDELDYSVTFRPTVGEPVETPLFNLNLGWQFALNFAGGAWLYAAPNIILRLEGRLWLAFIEESVRNETLTQNSFSIAASLGYAF